MELRMPAVRRLPSSLVIAVATASTLSTPVTAEEIDKTLVERIAKEKEDRKACKKLICDIAQKHLSDGADVACSVVKIWLPDDLKKNVLKGRLDWPYGAAQCKADVKMPRKMLSEVLWTGWARSQPRQAYAVVLA
jgi:hypothetical protein